ncbi:MAG: hypothetical protein ABRQ39_32705 [Candidatus Eremiobacterota bacterium]
MGNLIKRLKKVEIKRYEKQLINENERELTREELKEYDRLNKKLIRQDNGYYSVDELTDEEFRRYGFFRRWRHGRNINGVWHDGQEERLIDLHKYRYLKKIELWHMYFNFRLMLSIFYRIDIIWSCWVENKDKVYDIYTFQWNRGIGLYCFSFHTKIMLSIFHIYPKNGGNKK